MMRTMKLMMIL